MDISFLIRCLAWLSAAFILLVTVAPLRFKPRLPSRARSRLHVNLERGLAFAAMAFLFVAGFPAHPLIVGGLCVLAAALSELLQFLSSNRHAKWNDAMAKAVGAALGSAAAIAMFALRGANA
jgi:VanZ family protein